MLIAVRFPKCGFIPYRPSPPFFFFFAGGKSIGGVDGGIRVPGLFRWPEVIQPNSTSDIVTTHLDIFVLISSMTDVPLPRDRVIDGKDILSVLKGKMAESPYDFVYHYCDGNIHAVRSMPKNGEYWILIFHQLLKTRINYIDCHILNQSYNATRKWLDFGMNMWCRTIYVIYCSTTHK